MTMPFTLYDTRQKSLVPFEPRREGVVSIYNCGPTVYSTSHIGNFRTFLFTDVLRRFLEWRGYEVTQVMNITDVGHLTEDQRVDATGEDKLQKKARDLGWDPYRVARHYEDQFHADRKALNIQDAHHYPRATEHICDMLVQIQQLLDRGHAYIPEGTGEVYYDIASFPEYGKLSGKTLEDLRAGARVEINRPSATRQTSRSGRWTPATSCSGTRTPISCGAHTMAAVR
jgi:cysteinyl-tRNA synthetase